MFNLNLYINMATFSVNQNRQFYVATKSVTETPANLGEVLVKGAEDKYFYIQQMGQGGLISSDKICIDSIVKVTNTKAAALARPLKTVAVTLSKNCNNGKIISGQDYLLRIFFRHYVGNSDIYQESKYGAVHGIKDMNESTFYAKLAISLAKNFSREAVQLLKFFVNDSHVDTEVTATTKLTDLTGTYTSVKIQEVEQPWVLGTRKLEPVYFDVLPSTVLYDSEEVVWGETSVAADDTDPIGDGKDIADLEYFCMGERGDQYRNKCWPKVIPTKYMVDPSKEYDVLDIHYSYTGSGVDNEKSEKDITIVSATDDDALTGIIAAINTLAKNKKITVDTVGA